MGSCSALKPASPPWQPLLFCSSGRVSTHVPHTYPRNLHAHAKVASTVHALLCTFAQTSYTHTPPTYVQPPVVHQPVVVQQPAFVQQQVPVYAPVVQVPYGQPQAYVQAPVHPQAVPQYQQQQPAYAPQQQQQHQHQYAPPPTTYQAPAAAAQYQTKAAPSAATQPGRPAIR